MMKNTRTLQVLNVKRNDLQNVPIDINTPGFTLDMFKFYYAGLIAQGYILYDVYANSGFAALATKTAGKYLCVWTQGSDHIIRLPRIKRHRYH